MFYYNLYESVTFFLNYLLLILICMNELLNFLQGNGRLMAVNGPILCTTRLHTQRRLLGRKFCVIKHTTE